MNVAYRVRVYPTPAQATLLRRTFGCTRLVYNKALAARQARYATEKRGYSQSEVDGLVVAWKKQPEFAFLSEVSSAALVQALHHQHAAFQNFFAGRARYPRFRSRSGRQSAHLTRNAFRVKGEQLFIAKSSEPLQLVWSWPEQSISSLDVSSVVLSLEPDGRWFASLRATRATPQSLEATGETVGVDLGLKDFAVLSTGERIANPRYLARKQQRLKRYQRQLARCQRGSANRVKAKQKVARAHSKVRDARKDFLHQTSTELVRRFDRIGLEDLNVSGMLRNRKLARSISDVGWGEFRQLLEYKAARAGRQVVVIDRWYPSSKLCSSCGRRLTSLSLSTRHWTCSDCGTRHDRDLNAAKNIDTAAGLAVAASGGPVRPDQTTDRHGLAKEESLAVTLELASS